MTSNERKEIRFNHKLTENEAKTYDSLREAPFPTGYDCCLRITFDLGGGYEVDTSIYPSDEDEWPWCEAVLFKNGFEVGCTEPFDIEEFIGECSFENPEDKNSFYTLAISR